ncbi:uncharacterized protein [Littorina saxatilis]|uniref:uncharacterized protein n=1 Tax=Littorina saxatilis TaxID=31220 RepID=UPI0038B53EA2
MKELQLCQGSREDAECTKEGANCTRTTDCGDHMICNTTCACDGMYNVTSRKTCEKPCSDSSECEPGGRCFLTGNPPTSTCICKSGYSGANCQTSSSTYTIHVKTGSSDHAAAEARVGLVITGTQGTTERLKLSESAWSGHFKQGATDVFKMEAADVGNITSITISYYDILYDDRWLLDRVDIVKEQFTAVFATPKPLSPIRNSKCQSQGATYRPEGSSLSEFECGHTQHCQDSAHAAIITSMQELYNVTRCVCQGDVSGFFARLKTDNDTQHNTPISNNCLDKSHCDNNAYQNCFRREAKYRVECPTRCGYCDNDWLSMEGGESHKYRLVSVSGDNDTSCVAVCEDYEVRVLEVGCFGANQYAKPVLCKTTGASDDDDRDWLQCPVKSTTSVDSTTKEHTTEGQTTGQTSAETTTETTTGELTTTADPASTKTTSQPATTSEETTTTTTTTEATTETTTTTTSTTTEPTTTTTEPSTSQATSPATTYPETTFESTASETTTSPQDTCRTICDSDTPSNYATTTGDATPPDDTTTTDDATTRETTASKPAQTTPAPGYYPGVFTTTCNITFPQQPPGMTRAEFLELLAEQVRKELAVNVSSLSKTRAKKTSAPDHRKSSQTVGAAAIIFMVTVALLMMLSDLSRVFACVSEKNGESV